MKACINEDEILMLLNDVTIADEELSDIELSEPEVRKVHKDVLTKIKGKTSKRRKWLAAVSMALICTTIYISKPTIAATTLDTITTLIFGYNKSVEKAVKSNYIQPININPSYSNGVEIKLTNILMDKTTVALSFNLKFDDPKLLEIVHGVDLDLEIRDEKNRILRGYSNQDLSDKGMLGVISSGMENSEVLDRANGQLIYSLILNSDDANIPEMSKLKINIKSITLHQSMDPEEQVTGKWSFETDVSDKFSHNESINFTAKNIESGIAINSAETTPTGTLIKVSVPEKIESLDIFKNVILIDEKYDAQSTGGVNSTLCGRIFSEIDKRYLYTMTFPVTTFDNPSSLKLLIKDYGSEDIEIQLIRE